MVHSMTVAWFLLKGVVRDTFGKTGRGKIIMGHI